jgi:hypothetical protein
MHGNLLALAIAMSIPGQIPAEGPPVVPYAAPRARISEKAAGDTDVVLRWNEATLAAIKAERTPPPLAARNLAVVHVAIYDAMNGAQPTYKQFHVRKSSPGASSTAAAAVAAHRALLTLYPKQVCNLDAALDKALDAVPEGQAKDAGIELGQTVAEAVLDWRAGDLTMAKSGYTPRGGLGRWLPTPDKYQPPLLPEWTAAKPFALKEVASMRPAHVPELNSEEFISAYREVKVLGAINSRVRTRDEAEIARFWADGEGTITPPGHWNRIAQDAARQRGTTAIQNAQLFAMLNVALADVGIACWDCKYYFDYWRPVTAIRDARKLNNPELVAETDWMPLLPTPPFPSYTSGHSSFSGAAAAVLKEFFATDEFKFTSTSDGLPGVRRSFVSFSDAAKEAGMSRIYGGIHYSFDNRDGLDGGRKVGEFVSKKFFLPVE